MKLRTALASSVGVAGVTALGNRLLRSRAEEFEPYFDGRHDTYRWRGFDVAYTELGDPANQDLLLLHGISAAGSSHEFYAVAEQLSEHYHVVAPDLPGFGHSDRPPLLYSASLYTTFVRDAIDELVAEDAVVVASSLTGAYAALAVGQPDDAPSVGRLVLVCPSGTTMGDRNAWLRGLLRTPVVGQGLFNLLVSKPSIRHFHEDHGYYDIANLPEDIVEYEWVTAHQPGARFAPASFLSGFLQPEDDIGDALANVDAPVTLVWGRNADVSPLSEGRELAERADAGLVVLDHAKLRPHAEHPDEFVEIVREGVDVRS